tara:strand:+ start:663 stop:1541 length:879 start_codon:yes stop_codon:yes gene_type:complete
MKILVTGSNGQLGSEIRDLSVEYDKINLIFKDLPDLDICDFNLLLDFIKNHKINRIINCAAYTDVDKAEDNIELAKKINSDGVLNLVRALETVNGKLIHISSDYVFDGMNSRPYIESDIVNPIGVYGKTKSDGEKSIVNSSIDAIVIRTSWLYSCYGNNFVKNILSLGSRKKELQVVSDQIGSPTYAKDLAKICLDIFVGNPLRKISENARVYHYSNEGSISWFDFALEIIKIGNINCKVLPVLSKDYFAKVRRPAYSVLDKGNIKKDFNLEIPEWKESLEKCILKIKKHKN